MCDECYGSPGHHAPGCPNNDEPDYEYQCDICGDGFNDGVYTNGNITICQECFDNSFEWIGGE